MALRTPALDTVEAVTDIFLGPHPLDDDDMTEDVVLTALRHGLGVDHPRVPALARDITERLRAYEMHRLGCR